MLCPPVRLDHSKTMNPSLSSYRTVASAGMRLNRSLCGRAVANDGSNHDGKGRSAMLSGASWKSQDVAAFVGTRNCASVLSVMR